MTFLVIVMIIAAALLVLWFFRRRIRLRGDEESSEHCPTASNTVEDKTSTAVIGRSPDRLGREQIEEEPGKGAPLEKERIQDAPIEAGNSAESQNELDASAPQRTESHLPNEASCPKPIANDSAGSNEQLPPTNSDRVLSLTSSRTSPERDSLTTALGISGIREQYSSEEPTFSALAGTAIPDNNLQAEHTLPGRGAAQTATQTTDNELPQLNLVAEQSQLAQHTEDAVGEDIEKSPVRYRPPSQKPPRLPTAERVNQRAARAVPFEITREIRVCLRFDRFGFCEIRLLPERTSELDNEVEVKSGGLSLHLVAQEGWYEDLQFENIGERLRQGLELKGNLADHRRARWLLSGRDIYVLASHLRASYFVSTNRLALGRSHVVLCVVELLQEVEAILKKAECLDYTRLDKSHGVPSGWVGLRGVSPMKAIPLDLGTDQFYAIKPAPDIEIELEGGLCLRNSVWLAGFPPQIKLFGQVDGTVKVIVDAREASVTADGSVRVNGYDLPGQHSVYCEGLSCTRSYSIEEPPASWQEWAAYHFGEAEICGPLVRLAQEAPNGPIFNVPMSNPLLIGAEPGQIFRCSPRRVVNWKGFVPFDVVWALPAYPLTSDKKTARILHFANAPLFAAQDVHKAGARWSTAILDASRKGLQIENSSHDAVVLWREYKKAARNIWRAAR